MCILKICWCCKYGHCILLIYHKEDLFKCLKYEIEAIFLTNKVSQKEACWFSTRINFDSDKYNYTCQNQSLECCESFTFPLVILYSTLYPDCLKKKKKNLTNKQRNKHNLDDDVKRPHKMKIHWQNQVKSLILLTDRCCTCLMRL